ncbi:MAG: methyltransferase domain-containing protein [Calothrix sp. MO_192.B10]|nr:methyltransferase domain-containing protein [Calothrix sp. MO_192.B10]
MEPKEWLKWICSSRDLDELGKNYDQWSDKYEADVSQLWEAVPRTAALMLSKYIDDKQSLILDFGAGTGLVGVALAALGFEQIVGMDISPGMLTIAEEKGVYSSLICGSIGDEQLRNLDQVSGIIATGVFAENHAGSAELSKLQEIIKPEGILVFTVRQSFLPELYEVLNQPEWTLLDSQVMPIYDDPIQLLGYKASKPLN